jgi:hypothetical protein
VIPLNQLIPECLLALGGAFLLGNLAAYIRLRPAWRDAKEGGGARGARKGRGGPVANRDAKAAEGHGGRVGTRGRGGSAANEGRGGPAANQDARAAEGRADPTPNLGRGGPAHKGDRGGSAAARGSGGAKAAEGPRGGSAGRVSARVREPTPSGAKLPSRTRVLTNVLIGLLISLAALATLIRG